MCLLKIIKALMDSKFAPNSPSTINNTDNNSTDIVDIDDANTEKNESIDINMNWEEIKNIIDSYASNPTRDIQEIAVHCTATKEGRDVTIDEIDKWHSERGFSRQSISGRICGYHFVVNLNGDIMCGRDLREIGAHVSGHNTNSIGVCYVGGLDCDNNSKDTRTEQQKESLLWLIKYLKQTLNINKVQGHRDYSPDKNGDGIVEPNEWIKSCPSFDALNEYRDI